MDLLGETTSAKSQEMHVGRVHPQYDLLCRAGLRLMANQREGYNIRTERGCQNILMFAQIS